MAKALKQRGKIYDIGFGNELAMIPKAQTTEEKINWTTSKLKTPQRTQPTVKKQPTE